MDNMDTMILELLHAANTKDGIFSTFYNSTKKRMVPMCEMAFAWLDVDLLHDKKMFGQTPKNVGCIPLEIVIIRTMSGAFR